MRLGVLVLFNYTKLTMNTELFSEIQSGIESGTMSMDDIYNRCYKQNLSYGEAEQFFYSTSRDKRFELFIVLYHAALKNNNEECCKAFREAYCSSDNIFEQINQSSYDFDLKHFLFSLKNQGFDFKKMMTQDEKDYYNLLPEEIDIYRGMCDAEYQSCQYGISWSLSEETAKKYIYFDKNKVESGKGGLAHIKISKNEILTVFSVHGEMEVIFIHLANT